MGHEPLKRSVPFCSDNRAGIIADLAGSDSIERVFKTQLFIPRCKMAFSIGRGRNERGTFQQSTFINYNTYAGKAMNKSKTRMQFFYDDCGTYACIYTAKHNANERANTVYLLCTVTYTVLLDRRRHQHSFKSPKETQAKTPSQTRRSGWTTWVFMARDLEDRTGPVRP